MRVQGHYPQLIHTQVQINVKQYEWNGKCYFVGCGPRVAGCKLRVAGCRSQI